MFLYGSSPGFNLCKSCIIVLLVFLYGSSPGFNICKSCIIVLPVFLYGSYKGQRPYSSCQRIYSFGLVVFPGRAIPFAILMQTAIKSESNKFLEISKAFDKVLLFKLNQNGISCGLLKLFENYLHNRNNAWCKMAPSPIILQLYLEYLKVLSLAPYYFLFTLTILKVILIPILSYHATML